MSRRQTDDDSVEQITGSECCDCVTVSLSLSLSLALAWISREPRDAENVRSARVLY